MQPEPARACSTFGWVFGIFATLVMITLGVVAYDLAEAWFAPRCSSPREVGLFRWCLPIGFEGPFADIWGNWSVANARWDRTISFVAVLSAAVVSAYALRTGAAAARKAAYVTAVGALLIVLIKNVVLNQLS